MAQHSIAEGGGRRTLKQRERSEQRPFPGTPDHGLGLVLGVKASGEDIKAVSQGMVYCTYLRLVLKIVCLFM